MEKNNMKYSNNSIGFLAKSLILLLAVVFISSCKNEEGEDLYVNLISGSQTLDYTAAGGSEKYAMYSNADYWQIIPHYKEDDWVTVWPSEGSGDARFSLKVEKNEKAASRQALLHIVCDGKPIYTLTVNQTGVNPSIALDVNENGRVVSYKGETFSVGVKANINWVAELTDPDDASWISIGEYTDETQTFICSENTGSAAREAIVGVRAVGTDLCKYFTVKQPDKSSSFESAEFVTIADLLALGEGQISRNVAIKGTVISNRETCNYPVVYGDKWTNNTMFIDDGTAGLCVEFESENDNVYSLSDELVIHMFGQNIKRDAYTNGLKIDKMTGAAVQSSKGGVVIEPVIVEKVSDLYKYENRLVTLKNVEFVLPYGTLVNINEAGYLGKEQKKDYQASSDYNDLTLEYGHYLRDSYGNYTKLYTTWSFTERACKMIPEGSGDITGIVNKRYKADRYKGYSPTRSKEESWCIRIRNEADITNYQSPAESRISETVMQIGPWSINKTALEKVQASIGTGTLFHSVSKTVKGSTSGSTDQMYWAWAHVRNTAASFDPETGKWLPAYGNKTEVQHTAVMAQNWWKNTAAQYSDTDGCCWILSDLSTKGYTGQISLAFTASSNTDGPVEFQLEWAETADASVWTPIGSPYVCANWHCDIHAPEYVFVLPSELADKEGFALRMRATVQRNASDNADVANGTSRLGIIRMSCLK